MRTGKISENVLKRSVLRRCKSRNEKVAQGPAIGQDCAIVRLDGSSFAVMHTQAVTAERVEKIRYAVLGGVNNVSCAGGEACTLMMTVLLPITYEEAQLQEIMDCADAACQECGIMLAGGHTEVSEEIQVPVVTVTVQGIAGKEVHRTGEIQADLEVVMAGYPAQVGTALLAKEKEAELKKRFPLELVETAMQFDTQLCMKQAARIGWDCEAAAMHDVSQGGIFGALWEFCESGQTGLEADLRKIPIRQETIEICEWYGWNPYQLMSGGCLLMAVPNGRKTADQLLQAGICARVIGRTTAKKDRILHNGEEVRFLDKPAQDELCHLKRIDKE